MTPEQRRRIDTQAAWDARKEYRALEAAANARGVLNYYNINRGPRMPYHDRANDEQFDMADRDIANVELLEFGQVDEALSMMIDAAEAQLEMEDLNCRWVLGEVDPATTDIKDDYGSAPEPLCELVAAAPVGVKPYKSATAWKKDAPATVRFRSAK